jgi:hypothetical protein
VVGSFRRERRDFSKTRSRKRIATACEPLPALPETPPLAFLPYDRESKSLFLLSLIAGRRRTRLCGQIPVYQGNNREFCEYDTFVGTPPAPKKMLFQWVSKNSCEGETGNFLRRTGTF